jgi:hypothetical protein
MALAAPNNSTIYIDTKTFNLNYPVKINFRRYLKGKGKDKNKYYDGLIYTRINNEQEMRNGVFVDLGPLEQDPKGRYRLQMVLKDNNKVKYRSNKPIMLTDIGLIDTADSDHFRKFHLRLATPASDTSDDDHDQ